MDPAHPRPNQPPAPHASPHLQSPGTDVQAGPVGPSRPGNAGGSPPPLVHGRAPLTLDDLIGDLVWPKLLRTAGLALGPSRLGMAYFLVVIAGVLGWASQWAAGDKAVGVFGRAVSGSGATLSLLADHLLTGRWQESAHDLRELTVGLPWRLIVEHPAVFLLVAAPLVVAAATLGGAICRSAACDAALGQAVPWPRAVGFSVARWKSVIGAVVGPIAIVWAVALVISAAGWAVFSLPGMNLVGGAFYALFLVGGFVAAVTIGVFVIGGAMLLPAVVVEGTDAVDAMQRTYAYALGRPGRLVIYIVVLAAQAVVAIGAVLVVLWLIVGVAGLSTEWLAPARRAAMAEDAGPESGGATWAATRGLVHFWTAALLALGPAYAVSYFFSGASVLYLSLRRVHDGQDFSDIWLPGAVEAELSESMRGRSAPATAPTSEAVSDDGPADEG